MKSKLGSESVFVYKILDRPYSIIDVSSVVYSNRENKFTEFHNYWLNHKEYGYMMHMFGVFESDFHKIFDDLDDSDLDVYVNEYLDNINKIENEKE